MKKSYLIRSIRAPFEKFLRIEAASSYVLVACTIIALSFANSSWGTAYSTFWNGYFIELFSFAHFVNDGLMTVFFFVVGLEIKRELLIGELSSLKKASLPIFGAVGGMVVPALLFFFLNRDTPTSGGWGIPMATDIAFAVGIVTLLGKRVHPALKVFLLALAIVDDIGAILVIAIFYTSTINVPILLMAFGLIGVLTIGNVFRVHSVWFYSLVGLVVWYLFLESGVHATIAGVLVAFTVPASKGNDPEIESPLFRFENGLHSVVAFFIMPFFALANAGVPISNESFLSLSEPLPMGILIGLCIGKPLGITLFAWIGNRSKLASLAQGIRWRDLFLVSILGGIGFTMSLFITNLAFTDLKVIEEAKLGVLLASLVCGLVGYVLLSRKRIKS
jgi:NhaA family Na+:H+ antiporter